MPENQSAAVKAIRKSFVESFESAPDQWWFNGLFGSLEGVDAATASRNPGPGRPSVAAHVEHLRYTLEVVNAWLRGEKPQVDWEESWRTKSVDEEAWTSLQAGLRQQYERTIAFLDATPDPDARQCTILADNLAHSGYHVGSIRLALQLVQNAS
jgi:hypothetical protein